MTNSSVHSIRTWEQENMWESDWWGTCANTYDEERKQLTAASYMGLVKEASNKTFTSFDMRGKRIIDVGGGPCSLLLKCRRVFGVVVDPCVYPSWVSARYAHAGIMTVQKPAEDMEWGDEKLFDEAWCYNVLQHVSDPYQVLERMTKCAKVIRIFDWLYVDPSPGHPHKLVPGKFQDVLGTDEGRIVDLSWQPWAPPPGKAWVGVYQV